MAQYHERARVHAQPTPARSRPSAPGSTVTAKRIDCDTCPIAGRGCGDCMVALLGPVRFRLDDTEQEAVAELVAHGLVAVKEAEAAYAVPAQQETGDYGREEQHLRAIG